MFLPHHVNLPELGGVSFDKGCYLGQEIVARMHYRGTIRQHNYAIEGRSPVLPEPGEHIFNGEQKPIGGLLYAVPASEGFIGLASLVDEELERPEGASLHSESGIVIKIR
jgi:folate-binding Fe-S cluster repair protein YgfZ